MKKFSKWMCHRWGFHSWVTDGDEYLTDSRKYITFKCEYCDAVHIAERDHAS